MADSPVVHIGENSPEYVALQLFHKVAHAENFKVFYGPSGDKVMDRKLILDTYAECLEAVKGHRVYR